jgi:hypothetical protein
VVDVTVNIPHCTLQVTVSSTAIPTPPPTASSSAPLLAAAARGASHIKYRSAVSAGASGFQHAVVSRAAVPVEPARKTPPWLKGQTPHGLPHGRDDVAAADLSAMLSRVLRGSESTPPVDTGAPAFSAPARHGERSNGTRHGALHGGGTSGFFADSTAMVTPSLASLPSPASVEAGSTVAGGTMGLSPHFPATDAFTPEAKRQSTHPTPGRPLSYDVPHPGYGGF